MSRGGRRVALITGASYGVGAATAMALARDGCDVAVSATTSGNLATTLAELEAAGGRALGIALDVRDQSSMDAAFGAVLDAFGRLDVVVNNAGANLRRLAVDVTSADWDAVMATNLGGTFFMCQRAGRHWIREKQPGAIVNVSSTHGLVGAAERSTYGISKGGILQMTRMLAVEWAPHGIRVNAVAPGRLATESPSRAGTGGSAEYMTAMLARIPLHRLATVEEVAEAVRYLASPAAASVTGQALVIDGGLTAA